MSDTLHSGACLCGGVKIEVAGTLSPPDACHCSQCRKQSGHYWASTDVERSALTIAGEDHVRWYRSSEAVRRGFCKTCGSTLFWDPAGRDTIAVSMGLFDALTGAQLHCYIYTADKGDYYAIADGLPQAAQIPD